MQSKEKMSVYCIFAIIYSWILLLRPCCHILLIHCRFHSVSFYIFLLLINLKPIGLFMCWALGNDKWRRDPNKYEIPASLAGLDWKENCVISPWMRCCQGVIDIAASVHFQKRRHPERLQESKWEKEERDRKRVVWRHYDPIKLWTERSAVITQYGQVFSIHLGPPISYLCLKYAEIRWGGTVAQTSNQTTSADVPFLPVSYSFPQTPVTVAIPPTGQQTQQCG